MKPRVRKKTTFAREMLKQEARVILPPELDVVNHIDPDLGRPVRCVQLLIPPREGIFIGLDVDPGENGIGPDRWYKLPPIPSGAQIDFTLLPDQWLIGSVDEGMSPMTIICEYRWENG